MVALDFPSTKEALDLVDRLEEYSPYLKVGMQLYYLSGPKFIYQLKERGFKIFLDLKLHDIPNTVKGAAQSLTSLGVDMFNVHCAGGKKMMGATLEGVDKALSANQQPPQVIGVTQLTSTSQQVLNEEIGISSKMEEVIRHYAIQAKESGLHGVVCSPLEIEMIKETCGKEFITVTPGIRPQGANLDDQLRVTTPQDAAKLGTDFMVIGRAITQAANPVAAYEKILLEINGGK